MFKKILLPIDLQETELAVKALRIATDEARKHQAEIYVMTVLPGYGLPLVASFFPDQAMKEAMKEVAKVMKRYIRDNLPDDIVTHPVITEGNPPEQILRQAKKIDADLIVIPSHAKGLTQVFLGSCAAKVVEHAKCSVMVIKGG
jgi:nucleotide-binding universal stress UspA family protein